MDLRGCTGVFPQIMLGSMLPLHDARSARRFRTTIQSRRRNRCGCLAVKASSSRDEYEHGAGGPSTVDADMILLRKRIYELKQQENNCESPEEWMEWEKKWPGKYRSSLFQAMECLQFNLISTRPAVGMALLSLVSVSVPASVVLFLMNCATCLMAVIGDGHG